MLRNLRPWIILLCAAALLISCAAVPPPAGQEARLVGNGAQVLFSRDLPTFDQVTHFDMTRAADRDELMRLNTIGAVSLLPSGTRVLVLDDDLQHYKVQIIGGDHDGATGYVPATFVQQ